MKYTKYILEREITNPIQSILFLTTFILFAPYRFLSEMFKRILFLGEYTRKVLISCLVMNLSLFILVVSRDIAVLHRINLFHGVLSIGSLIVSLLLTMFVFILFVNSNYPVNLNKVKDLDKDTEVEKIENLHKSVKEVKLDLNKSRIPKDETLTSCIAKHLDVLKPEEDVTEVISTLPKIEVDDIYKFNKGESMTMEFDKLMNKMVGRNNMSNYDQDEKKIISKTKDDDYKKEFGMTKDQMYSKAYAALENYDEDEEDEIQYEIHSRVMKEADRKCRELDASKLPSSEDVCMFLGDDEEEVL